MSLLPDPLLRVGGPVQGVCDGPVWLECRMPGAGWREARLEREGETPFARLCWPHQSVDFYHEENGKALEVLSRGLF